MHMTDYTEVERLAAMLLEHQQHSFVSSADLAYTTHQAQAVLDAGYRREPTEDHQRASAEVHRLNAELSGLREQCAEATTMTEYRVRHQMGPAFTVTDWEVVE